MTGMDQYLSEQGEEDLGRFRQSLMTSAVFTGENDSVTNLTGWFNNEAYHTPATAVNVLTNTLLQYYTNEQHEIRTVNHPLPRAINNQLEQEINTSTIFAFLVSFYVYFGMCFMMATFIVFLIKERSNKSKHIQVSTLHTGQFAIFYILLKYSLLVFKVLNFCQPPYLSSVVNFSEK